MKSKIAFSQKKELSDIIQDIQEQLQSSGTKLILFFSSSNIDPLMISNLMQKSFPGIPVVGCSTSGEIVSGKMLDDSVVAMALGDEIIEDTRIEIINNISSDSKSIDKAFSSFEAYFKIPMSDLDPARYVGIALIDGLSLQEEKLNERIGDLTNVTFVGGSAGDDLKFKKTYLYSQGKTYSDAAVLILVKAKTKFEVLKTQSFRTTNKKVIVTKADEAKRKIIQLNGKPAVEEYARLLNKTGNNLSESFASNPLGLVFEKDFFVRSPQKTDGNNIDFYCSIKEGMELCILESKDIINDTKFAIQDKVKSFGPVSALINFNCILRTLELKEKKITREYGELFKEIPTIGFSTYGESYIGHINQTSVMLLFK